MKRFKDKVTICDRIHRIIQKPFEPKFLCYSLAVDIERISFGQSERTQWRNFPTILTRESPTAQRRSIDPLDNLPKPLQIGCKGYSVRKQPMTPSHRLRFLQVRITR